MTVIAWDGVTLAADKLSVRDGLRGTTTKIYRVGDSLVGFCGDAAQGAEMVAWAERGFNPEDFPASQRGEGWAPFVRVTGNGRVLAYEKTPYPVPSEGGFYAAGSGREIATTALHLGLGAVRAVELAAELTIYCGGGVDTLRLQRDLA